MRKGNEHKKMYPEDKFGRKWYCQHAALNLTRHEKRAGIRKTRSILKKGLRGEINVRSFDSY